MCAAFSVANLSGAIAIGADDAALTSELQAGSEEAFALLIARYQSSVYSLVSRILTDPSDAADTTQDVFIKVFRGIRNFNGQSSLRTWIYRIALHEASNQRRWWSRHRGREITIDDANDVGGEPAICLKEMLIDHHDSPYEMAAHEEIRAKVETALRHLPEPFRTTVILRDLEGLPYDEIAEILGVQLGTVKSRLIRGRTILRERLADYVARARRRPAAVAARRTPVIFSGPGEFLREEAG